MLEFHSHPLRFCSNSPVSQCRDDVFFFRHGAFGGHFCPRPSGGALKTPKVDRKDDGFFHGFWRKIPAKRLQVNAPYCGSTQGSQSSFRPRGLSEGFFWGGDGMNVKGGDLLQAKVMNFVWVCFVFFNQTLWLKKAMVASLVVFGPKCRTWALHIGW